MRRVKFTWNTVKDKLSTNDLKRGWRRHTLSYSRYWNWWQWKQSTQMATVYFVLWHYSWYLIYVDQTKQTVQFLALFLELKITIKIKTWYASKIRQSPKPGSFHWRRKKEKQSQTEILKKEIVFLVVFLATLRPCCNLECFHFHACCILYLYIYM